MPCKDKAAQSAYQAAWLKKRRAEWFADKKCVDCGSSENLELDHVDPTQKVTHRVWGWSRVRREIELAKCVARCHGCHQAKTNDEITGRAAGVNCGTYTGYRNGCRCIECKEARYLYRKGFSSASGSTLAATSTATGEWGEFPVHFKPSSKLLKLMNLVPGTRLELVRFV